MASARRFSLVPLSHPFMVNFRVNHEVKASKPKWASPERQTQLVKLFIRSKGFCVFGHKPCKGKWESKTIALCRWGKWWCSESQAGLPCRFKPEEGKPRLTCELVHVTIRRWKCGYGESCYNAVPVIGQLGNHLWQGEAQFEQAENRLIREWAGDDRAKESAEWQAERKALHSLAEPRFPIRGRFNTISKDIYFANQPLFYLEAIGMSGLTLKPFAKIRLASSPVRLHVDLGDSLKPVSKHKRRKAIRYGKTKGIEGSIKEACWLAVKHYLKY